MSYYLRTKAISTGAKHLALDIEKSTVENVQSLPENPSVDYSAMNLPAKPEDSAFDCFGCSS
jgi:hypothetical protein